jgi:hypothetical protein
MRKLTSMERCLLAMGILITLVAAWLVVFPREFTMRVPAGRFNNDSYSLHANKSGCRVFGIVDLGVGLGLCFLAVYPLKP